MTNRKTYTESDVCNMVGSLFVICDKNNSNKIHLFVIVNRITGKPIAKKMFPYEPACRTAIWYCHEIVNLLNDERYHPTII